MTDPVSGAVVVKKAAELLTPDTETEKKFIFKIFGPSADVLGEELSIAVRRWSSRMFGNAKRVADAAGTKTSSGAQLEIAPRVAYKILGEAVNADEPFMAEYLSGVLAAAKNANGADDRAIPWADLVGRLSSDQLCLHYVLYRHVRHHMIGRGYDSEEISTHLIFVPFSTLFGALNFSEADMEGGEDGSPVRFIEAFTNLKRESLVGESYVYGPPDEFGMAGFQGNVGGQVTLPGLAFMPSVAGLLLFLRAHGFGEYIGSSIQDETLEFKTSVVGLEFDYATSFVMRNFMDNIASYARPRTAFG